MRRILFVLMAGACWTFSSCDECNCDGALYGDIRLKVTQKNDTSEVLVTIFEGNIENQDTILSEYINESIVTYTDFVAGRRYSATAHYSVDGKNIVAVDGKKMHTNTDDCDCEYAQEVTLNLKLK